ncbi:MAG: hypothetical protein DWQ10_16375 [Calditrichaeota bacterium]|nr:MAG: hypothetical protein DWQ10_16375 [Calditrichota bacterium]
MPDKKQIEKIRKTIHDLRASHHAANLNAQAAGMLSKKINSAEGEKIAKHIAFLSKDLGKFIKHLDTLSSDLKNLK